MEDVTMDQMGAALARGLTRIQELEDALPDPDKLLWLTTWLDKTYAVVTAFADHHDRACRERDLDPATCGDIGPGEKRDKLLEFMDSKVQDDLRDMARKIKEVQSHG